VEGVRAETIIRAATVAGSLERLLEAGHEILSSLLRARTEGNASPGRSWPDTIAFFDA
jgi:hypothetical protein